QALLVCNTSSSANNSSGSTSSGSNSSGDNNSNNDSSGSSEGWVLVAVEPCRRSTPPAQDGLAEACSCKPLLAAHGNGRALSGALSACSVHLASARGCSMSTSSHNELVLAILENNTTAAIRALDGEIKTEVQRGPSRCLASLYQNRGYCKQRLQLYRQALKDFDAAVELAPDYLEALYRKGQVLVALKRLDDAVHVWQAALSKASPHSDLHTVVSIATALQDPSGTAAALLASPSPFAAPSPAPASSVAPTPASSSPSTASPTAPLPAPTQIANGQGHSPPPTPLGPSPLSASTGPGTSGSGAVPGPSSSSAPRPGPKAPSPVVRARAAAAPPGPAPAPPDPSFGVEQVDCAAVQAHNRGLAAKSGAGQGGPRAGGPEGVRSSVLNQLPPAVAIQLAVNQINAGQAREAEQLLDALLRQNPKELGALVARGTARALRRELRGAVEDFSAAIAAEPRYHDTWKRRGQARSALGELEGALADLTKAAELLPLWGT
ncbi:hypothetical protein QJQ45_018877, partial [Haematococcus lacustris]